MMEHSRLYLIVQILALAGSPAASVDEEAKTGQRHYSGDNWHYWHWFPFALICLIWSILYF